MKSGVLVSGYSSILSGSIVAALKMKMSHISTSFGAVNTATTAAHSCKVAHTYTHT